MPIDGFSDDDFADLSPKKRSAPVAADLTIKFIFSPKSKEQKLQFNFNETILAEIHCADPSTQLAFGWSAEKKAFRFKHDRVGLYRPMMLARGQSRRLIRTPTPSGVFSRDGYFEPEFYVDTSERQIIIECPAEMLTPGTKLLPPPLSAPRTTVGGISLNSLHLRVINLLSEQKIVTPMMICKANGTETVPVPEKMAASVIQELRDQTLNSGFRIETVFGQGYRIHAADKAQFQNFLAAVFPLRSKHVAP